jgi:hypothetical protein
MGWRYFDSTFSTPIASSLRGSFLRHAPIAVGLGVGQTVAPKAVRSRMAVLKLKNQMAARSRTAEFGSG